MTGDEDSRDSLLERFRHGESAADDRLTASGSPSGEQIRAATARLGEWGRRTPRPALGGISWAMMVSTLGVVLLVALVAPFVIHAVPTLVGAEHSYVVTSGSMEPAIGVGSVVMVNDVAPGEIGQGDVITYRTGENAEPTTHRVVEVVERDGGVAYRTAGDANEEPDPELVAADQVEGRVMTVGGHLFVIPHVGYAIAFANTRPGYVAMVVVPIALLLVSEMYDVLFAAGSDTSRSDSGTDSRGEGAGRTEGVREGTHGRADAEEGARAEVASARDGRARPPRGEDVPREDSHAARDRPPGDAVVEDGEGTYSFALSELRVATAALALFAAYSLWVAYVNREVWSTATAGAAVVAFVLVAGLYLTGDWSAPDDQQPSDSTGERQPPAPHPEWSSNSPERTSNGGRAVPNRPDVEGTGESPVPRRSDSTVAADTPPAGAIDAWPASTGPLGPDGPSRRSSNRTGVVVRQERPDEEVLAMPRQTVASFAVLTTMAATIGRPIYQDWESETHYLRGRKVLYVHDAAPDEGETSATSSGPGESGMDEYVEGLPGESREADEDRSHHPSRANRTPPGEGRDG